MLITSAQNSKIKDLLSLCEKSKERRERGLFVVEGEREYRQCIEGGFVPETVFYSSNANTSLIENILQQSPPESNGSLYFEVSRYVYDKIAYRGSTEGVVAIFKERKLPLSEIKLGSSPFVILLESVEKPGNLGAVLRTADGCGADAVVICDPLTDLYNPNLIRSSLGGVFSQQVATASSEEAYKWLKNNKITIYTAQLQDSCLYYDADFCKGCAIVFGAESTGLTPFWREHSDRKIRIPMLGKMDSLNISASAAVMCYEVVRQRKIAK